MNILKDEKRIICNCEKCGKDLFFSDEFIEFEREPVTLCNSCFEEFAGLVTVEFNVSDFLNK